VKGIAKRIAAPTVAVLMAASTVTSAVALFSATAGAATTGSWTEQSPTTSPGARSNATLAYDSATANVVLFGGSSTAGGSALADTWTWSGTTWTQLSPTTSPPARYLSTMAFDPAIGKLLLFGGFSGSGNLADTWTWNGATWTQLSPATSPPARNGASMAYDPATGNMVLFGGSGSANLADTWTFDGTTWTQQSPTTSPSARYGASMAYDQATGNIVLFGGTNGGVTPESDTWTWNGITWTLQAPTASPPQLFEASLSYDPGTGNLVLFGGFGASGDVAESWTWDGSTWTELSPSTSPAARADAQMAYDPATANLVLFGGNGLGGELADTWTFAPTGTPSWAQLSPSSSPPARAFGTMAYDAAAGNMVLFGGWAPAGLLADTWTFNGTTWTNKAPATSPAMRQLAEMAYDPATGTVLLYGGIDYGLFERDTWSWNGSNWTQLNPSTSPSYNSQGSLAYDPALHEMLLFGGYGLGPSDLNATWAWNGSNWTQLNPSTSPLARQNAQMAYDPATGNMVLFGGSSSDDTTAYSDTWTFNGSTWTQQSPMNSPPGRSQGTMVYDGTLGEMILTGGSSANGTSTYNDTWAWNGSNWTQLAPGTSAPSRFGSTMAYDPAIGSTVLFGGVDHLYNTYSNTWTYKLELPQSVSFTASAPTSAVYGGGYTPVATGGASGNAVTFSVDSSSATGACSYSSGTGVVSFTGPGNCVIDANQSAGGNYAAATQQQQSFAIVKAPQTVAFTSSMPSGAVPGGSYSPGATGGASGNAVTFSVDSSSTAGACSYSSGTGVVSFAGSGTCLIDANEAGSANYSAAARAQQSFAIGWIAPTAPTAVSAVTTSGGLVSTVGLSWTAPSGGSAVTSYQVTTNDLTTTKGSSVSVVGTSTTIGSLVDGDAYDFSVVAVNGGGDSPASLSNSVVPVGAAPIATSSGTSSSSSGAAVAGGASSAIAAIGTGSGEVVVGQYSSNPVAQLQATRGSQFFDVATTPGSSFSTVDITICGLPPRTSIDWWNPITQVLTAPSQETSPVGGCVTVTVDASSSPSLSDLYGTVFVSNTPTVSTVSPSVARASTVTVSTSGHRVFGGLVKYTAAIADSAGGVSGGTVSFAVGKHAICNATVSGGTASCSSRKAPRVGSTVLAASYSGTTGVTSSVTASVVDIQPDKAVLRLSLRASPLGKGLFRVTVAVAASKLGSGVPRGHVVLTIGRLRYGLALEHQRASIVVRIATKAQISVAYFSGGDFRSGHSTLLR
jgi:hypothetical protein